MRRAVYLIFPAHGLLASHERCLRYLDKKGVATTVVSNLPMSKDDQRRALALCHNYIERPNFGYDFGGYRDGVLSLKEELTEVKQLVLLNDSSWFPIIDTTDWLEDVNALNVDFAAAASNYGLPRPDPEAFRDIVFDYQTDHPNFHYCSYALSFGERMIQHPRFLKYWQRFPLSNSKKRTVRRGEIGLTQWALKTGMTHGATLDIAGMAQNLSRLDENRLQQIAEMLIVMDDRRMRQVQQEMNDQLGAMPKADIVRFILATAARKGVSYATAEFNIFNCGFPFLKKSPVWLEEDTSDKTLQILEKLNTPAAAEALREAQDVRARRFAPAKSE
ncbi:rhamnan synthesis F family protein [Roseobacter sp. EG26]